MPSQFTVKSTVSLSSWKYFINIRQADDLLKESSQSIIHTKMVLLLPEHYLDNDSSRMLPFLFQIFLFSPSLSPKETAKALEHTCTCNLHLPTHSFHLSSVSSIVITACSMGPPNLLGSLSPLHPQLEVVVLLAHPSSRPGSLPLSC